MLTNAEEILQVAQRLIEAIEESSESDLAVADGVMVIVAVNYGRTDDGEAEVGSLFYRCSSGRPHIQFGLLRHCERAILREMQTREDDS